jgi:prefoldin subunit 5
VPKLLKAREDVVRMRANARAASSPAHAVKQQMDRLLMRQQRLTADRTRVETVQALRQIKSELADIDDHLEILQRKHDPLAASATTIGQSLRHAEQQYADTHHKAVSAWESALQLQLYGQDEGDKRKRFARLDTLVGAAEGSTLLEGLTIEQVKSSGKYPEPPWLHEKQVR